MIKTLLLMLALVGFWIQPEPCPAVRLKELVSMEGARDNLLLGYGLVVGLDGTGDGQQTVFSTQSLSNLLRKMGVFVEPRALRVNNVAAAMVTATLPPFASPGTRIDVVVSSIGDADSLQGGTLLLTSLKAANGEVYAVAQGPLSIGGFSVGQAGTGVQVNHPTVGRIPEGASPRPTSALRLSAGNSAWMATWASTSSSPILPAAPVSRPDWTTA